MQGLLLHLNEYIVAVSIRIAEKRSKAHEPNPSTYQLRLLAACGVVGQVQVSPTHHPADIISAVYITYTALRMTAVGPCSTDVDMSLFQQDI